MTKRIIFFNTKGQIRPGYLIILATVILIGSTLIAQIAASLVNLIFPNATVYTHFGSAPVTIVYTIFYGFFTWWLSKIVFKKFFQPEDLAMVDCFTFNSKVIKNIGGGMLLGVVAIVAVVIPLYITGDYAIDFGGFEVITLLLYFCIFIAIGISEEVILRGLMQHALMRYNKWAALVIISAVFGIFHLSNPNFTIVSLLGIFLAGMFLGLSMYATGSITVAIGTHLTWNFFQGPVLGIPVSGMGTEGSIFITTIEGANDLITGGEFGAESSLSCLIVLTVISFTFYLHYRKKERRTVTTTNAEY